jgi:hypothetical protein
VSEKSLLVGAREIMREILVFGLRLGQQKKSGRKIFLLDIFCAAARRRGENAFLRCDGKHDFFTLLQKHRKIEMNDANKKPANGFLSAKM